MISQTRSQKKTKKGKQAQSSADAALLALSQILQSHPQAVASSLPALWNLWVSSLPCQVDQEAGQKNHKLILMLLEQQKPEILGAGGQNLPQLLTTLVDVYQTDMVDDATS